MVLGFWGKIAPDRSGRVRTVPGRSEPVQTSPDRSGPDRSGPVRPVPDRTVPDRSDPDQSGPVRTSPCDPYSIFWALDRSETQPHLACWAHGATNTHPPFILAHPAPQPTCKSLLHSGAPGASKMQPLLHLARRGLQKSKPYCTLAPRGSKNATPTICWCFGAAIMQPLLHFWVPLHRNM